MKVLLLSLSLLLGACQTLEEAGQFSAYRIPPGTVLELHQDLTIPPLEAGVYIQGTAIGDRYRYEATCRLEVNSVDASPRPVSADRFTVTGVSRESQMFSGRMVPGVRYASAFSGGDCPCLLTYTTYLYLHSQRQPDVSRLVCSHLQDSGSGPRHLTAAEIRTKLAPVMTLY